MSPSAIRPQRATAVLKCSADGLDLGHTHRVVGRIGFLRHHDVPLPEGFAA